MSKFSLKTFLLTLTIVALAIGLFLSRRELAEKSRQLREYRDEMRYLDIEDEHRIHAISIPGFGRKSWRWRLYVPPERNFRLRFAFDDIPMNGLPENAPDLIHCELPPGESILSATIANENGQWGINLYSETDGMQNFDFTADIVGNNTAWLSKRGGCSQFMAGGSSTQDGAANEPFILLSYRDGLSPSPGVVTTNPSPTDGVLMWIQEIQVTR